MRRLLADRDRGDDGMTVVELLVTSTVLVLLLGMVLISVTLINDVGTNVTSQFQEFDQALPALAPFHTLLGAQVESGPEESGVPNPPFSVIGNFTMTFYANVGTGYGNVVGCPAAQPGCSASTAGPAMIVAGEYDGSGDPVTVGTGGTSCSASTPCSLEVRMYLPQTGATGTPSCPILWGGSVTGGPCTYSSTYQLLADVQNVVNDPSDMESDLVTPAEPIFSYGYFDPGGTYNSVEYYPQSLNLTATDIQDQSMSLVGLGYGAGAATSQSLDPQATGCGAVSASYPTPAIACPADAIQSVGIDLMVAKPGANAQGTVEDHLVVYRYAQSPGSPTAPYQYSETNG